MEITVVKPHLQIRGITGQKRVPECRKRGVAGNEGRKSFVGPEAFGLEAKQQQQGQPKGKQQPSLNPAPSHPHPQAVKG